MAKTLTSTAAASKDFDARQSVDIILAYPPTVDGVTYDVLTMRRPKNRDSLKIAGMKNTNDARKGMVYFADLCTFKGEPVSPDVIEELDDVDSEALGEQLKAFTGKSAD